jgi:hypothetical protein
VSTTLMLNLTLNERGCSELVPSKLLGPIISHFRFVLY